MKIKYTTSLSTIDMITVVLLPIIFIGAVILGEILCIYKAVKCNWEPIGKAEIIYTAGIFTPLGPVIGYINIEDK
jgi:hypothetical protein